MRKLQNTLAQLNENNFDTLNNAGMSMLKGGFCAPHPCCNAGIKSKKSKKSKKSIKGIKIKSKKSRKNNGGGYYPCAW